MAPPWRLRGRALPHATPRVYAPMAHGDEDRAAAEKGAGLAAPRVRVTPSIALRIRWHAQMVRDLFRARSRFRRGGDWLALLGVYAAHSLAGFLGVRTIRCRMPLPADTPPVTIRLGTADFHVVKELYVHDVYGFANPALIALRPP